MPSMYPDGTLVKGPKALCELQGYVYDAWLRMAEIYDALGNRAARRRAAEEGGGACSRSSTRPSGTRTPGFYAFAFDGDKKKVLSVSSNAGHCLWSGIVAPERAGRVVKRLMQPDMWSGWGIRTLSADHPVVQSVQLSDRRVWPHDNGIIALGFGATASPPRPRWWRETSAGPPAISS